MRAVVEVFGEAILTGDHEALKEAFTSVQRMLTRDDAGWVPLVGGSWQADEQYGLKLADLKQWSKKIREAIVGAPWIGRGFRLRANYVWENGVRYGNVTGSKQVGGIKGKKNIQDVIDRPGNQFHFFSKDSRRAREECLYADGVAFWIGNETTRDLEAIPLWQIDDVLLEPNGLGYAVAYKRKWTYYDFTKGEATPLERWYFTDQWATKRPSSIKRKGESNPIPVDQKHIIFDLHANRSTGLVFGAPDALAAWVWNGVAREAVGDGRAMQQALATFAMKASVKNQAAATGTALQLATPQTAGSTAVVGQANDLVPMSSAGKGYDFKSLLFLVAIVASSLDVSVVHLTASPGDAGGSYGASQTLDTPTRLAMEARRDLHVDFDARVLRWMGADDPDVSFIPFDADEAVYRKIQGLTMALNNDSISRQEFRNMLDDLLGRPNGTVPDEDQRNSVLQAKAMAKVAGTSTTVKDPSKVGDGTSTTTVTRKGGGGASLPQTANPAQGRSNGTGGQSGSANDIRRGK